MAFNAQSSGYFQIRHLQLIESHFGQEFTNSYCRCRVTDTRNRLFWTQWKYRLLDRRTIHPTILIRFGIFFTCNPFQSLGPFLESISQDSVKPNFMVPQRHRIVRHFHWEFYYNFCPFGAVACEAQSLRMSRRDMVTRMNLPWSESFGRQAEDDCSDDRFVYVCWWVGGVLQVMTWGAGPSHRPIALAPLLG